MKKLVIIFVLCVALGLIVCDILIRQNVTEEEISETWFTDNTAIDTVAQKTITNAVKPTTTITIFATKTLEATIKTATTMSEQNATRRTREYPETATETMKKNRKIIMKNLDFNVYSTNNLVAHLHEIGVEEIISLKVLKFIREENKFEVGGVAEFTIVDTIGQTYFLRTDSYGHYLKVQLDDSEGKYVYDRLH